MSLRIMLINPSRPVYGEANAAEAITPGHFIQHNASGAAIKNATADVVEAPLLVAVENDMFGKEITDAYAIGERVIYQHAQPGCEVYALVAAAAPAIVYNDFIGLAADGTVKKAASAAASIGRARGALDNSGGGSAARLRILIN
jgi:hypothetical protein